ncbi:uncharacterized protein LOC116349526 [Contarinia nasturtii]|uniref:uncharacterized protein LOC116349526 n=1 Tax=Contarinia nasturtii TaxID=265458 RepID=UPI0012D3829D|nr:uncharacterized protein LOC116349526 [Contarinia nasturtii]
MDGKHNEEAMCVNNDDSDDDNSSSSDETEEEMEDHSNNKEREIIAPLFENDMACFHEVFDWLSLEQIQIVASTCKRLEVIAGTYYRTYLQGKLFSLYDTPIDPFTIQNQKCLHRYRQSQNMVRMNFFNANPPPPYPNRAHSATDHCDICLKSHMNHLNEFIQKFRIDCGNFSYLQPFLSTCTSLKHIELHFDKWKTKEISEEFERILKKVEVVIMKCGFPGNLYWFLQYCKNLKRLSVQNTQNERQTLGYYASNNSWLCKRYPKLEHIELNPKYSGEFFCSEIETFIKLNSHIKSLAVDMQFLECDDLLLQSDIKLDDLALSFELFDMSYHDDEEETAERDEDTFDLLHKLYEQGFYKRLHLYECEEFSTRRIERLSKLPGLETFHWTSWRIESFDVLKDFTNLKELQLSRSLTIVETEFMAKNLQNLERIYFWSTMKDFNLIVPFIQHSVKLNKIVITRFDKKHSAYAVLNLLKLNEEREKLLGGRQIIIFVEEAVFLHFKWKNWTIETKMIELRRAESHQWNRRFSTKSFSQYSYP